MLQFTAEGHARGAEGHARGGENLDLETTPLSSNYMPKTGNGSGTQTSGVIFFPVISDFTTQSEGSLYF